MSASGKIHKWRVGLQLQMLLDDFGPVRSDKTAREIIESALCFLDSMPDWISTVDQMPEENRIVIVAGGVGFHQAGKWFTAMGPDYPRPITWPVTHWMPPLFPSTTIPD